MLEKLCFANSSKREEPISLEGEKKKAVDSLQIAVQEKQNLSNQRWVEETYPL